MLILHVAKFNSIRCPLLLLLVVLLGPFRFQGFVGLSFFQYVHFEFLLAALDFLSLFLNVFELLSP